MPPTLSDRQRWAIRGYLHEIGAFFDEGARVTLLVRQSDGTGKALYLSEDDLDAVITSLELIRADRQQLQECAEARRAAVEGT